MQNVYHCNSVLCFSAVLHFILWSFCVYVSKPRLAVKNIKCTLNTFCLPVNTLNVLRKLFKSAMTDMCSLKRKLLALNETEAVKSAWTDQATLYRIHAGIVVHVRCAQFVCRLVQFAVRLSKARLKYSYVRPPGDDAILTWSEVMLLVTGSDVGEWTTGSDVENG